MSETIRAKNYERGKQIVRGASQLYIDLDVEADGVAGYGSLLSIGAVSPAGETFYRELKPTSELWVLSQHDFCEEHNLQRQRLLDEGMPPAEAIGDLQDWDADLRAKYRKNGSVLVAFNASFDYPLIDLEFKKAGIKDPFGVAGYCIKSLALALDPKHYNWQKTAKGTLPRDIVPDGDFTHHALEDAIYQQKLHYSLVGKLAWRQNKLGELLKRRNEDRMPTTEHTDLHERVYGYHRDVDGGIFECERCTNHRDCMEDEVLRLTRQEAIDYED